MHRNLYRYLLSSNIKSNVETHSGIVAISIMVVAEFFGFGLDYKSGFIYISCETILILVPI